MGWDDEDYNSGSDTFNTVGSSYKSKSSKTKIPHFRPIVKKRIPRTDFGEAMGGLTVGMLFVFPAIALLTMAAPLVIFSIIGIIALFTWISTSDIKFALIILGVCLAPVILGFISIGFYMMLFGG